MMTGVVFGFVFFFLKHLRNYLYSIYSFSHFHYCIFHFFFIHFNLLRLHFVIKQQHLATLLLLTPTPSHRGMEQFYSHVASIEAVSFLPV